MKKPIKKKKVVAKKPIAKRKKVVLKKKEPVVDIKEPVIEIKKTVIKNEFEGLTDEQIINKLEQDSMPNNYKTEVYEFWVENSIISKLKSNVAYNSHSKYIEQYIFDNLFSINYKDGTDIFPRNIREGIYFDIFLITKKNSNGMLESKYEFQFYEKQIESNSLRPILLDIERNILML